MSPIIDQVVKQLEMLPDELQWRVLEFTRVISGSLPHGTHGQQLLQFAGAILLSDLDIMSEAIEQGCEWVDANGW